MSRSPWRIFLVALSMALMLGLVPLGAARADDPPPQGDDNAEVDTWALEDVIDYIKDLLGDDAGSKMEGDGLR